jgi:hypothetical protein
MGGNHKAVFVSPQPPQIIESAHRLRRGAEIQQQDVPTFNAPLDALNQRDAALGGIRDKAARIQLAFVQRNCERAIAQGSRSIDELSCSMGNAVDRVVGSMRVELDLQHRSILA